ncbi:MAG: GNAT family N-acetyltransferase [Clostridia bacterium]|nr:GNAT family N-acetyltransferase [Clostridia bacterium]
MLIRHAEKSDIPKLLDLLRQVHSLHAEIRPDIFVSDKTKFTAEQLSAMLDDEKNNIYVAVSDAGEVVGHVFYTFRDQAKPDNMHQFRSAFIDDLCVDKNARRAHIGNALFEFVKEKAKQKNCYEIVLAVWEGNDDAKAFYDKMGMKPKETLMEYILD